MADWFQRWVRKIGTRSVLQSVERDLDGVFLLDEDRIRAEMAQGPLVIAANHVGWWDGMVLVALNHRLGANGHVLMDAEQLARFPFFQAVGALPIDLGGGAASRRGLKRAQSVLNGPGDVLWVFPQGEHRPQHVRPLGFKAGVRLIARGANARVLPMGISYRWADAPAPQIWLAPGTPVAPREPDLMPQLEGQVIDQLERIDGEPDHASVIASPPGRPTDWATQLLCAMWRLRFGGQGLLHG